MAAAKTTDTRDDEVDLNALLGTLLDHKWLIAIVTSVFLVVAVAYAFVATPIYQANGLVQVEQEVPDLPSLSAITQTLGASSSQDLTEISILQSRLVLEPVIKNLNLNTVVVPYQFPVFGGFIARHFTPDKPGDVASPWLGIGRYDWGGSKLDVFQLDVPHGLLGKELTLIAGKAGSYTLYDDDDNELLRGQVGQVAKGHGVTVQVRTLRANPGMHFAVTRNATITTIGLLQQAVSVTEQGQNSGMIQLTYQDADSDLAVAVINQVEQAYVRQNVEKSAGQAASSLKFVQEQLPKAREQLDKAQAALNAFQIKAHSVNITLQTKALLDQVVGIDTSIQQLQVQQADVARRFTKKHPAYKALMQQIGTLQEQKQHIQDQVNQLPDAQKQLLGLTEDVKVSNANYTNLLNQAQQLEIARAGTIGNVRVVDTGATDTTKPVSPKRALIVVGGTFFGGFLAVVFVFLRQMLNRGLEDPAEIEKLGLPVYAAIPLSRRELEILPPDGHHRGDGRQHLLAIDTPADLAVEALRSLRTSLHFARLEATNNVLMLSGSSPSAGKTFVSTNLAVVMAQSGQRVLVIDSDLRKGSMHRVLGGRPENGLSELISGQIVLDDALRAVSGVDNLRFIARGKIPPNPSELLMHPAFKSLLAKLMQSFDLVIVDTPPILAVTDAAVVGQHAGTNLLVVRFGVNQAREVALAKQRFEQNGVKIKGAIFNAVEKRTSGYYSYGYYEYRLTEH